MKVTRRSVLRSIPCGAAAALWPRAYAQSTGTTPPGIAAYVPQFMKQYSVPGMTVSYMRGATLLFSGAFGEANIAKHEPVREDSLFRIASNSKAFTSAAIFLLIEAKKLALEDKVFAPGGPLHQYTSFSPQPEWLGAITVHHLLTHTAGGWGNRSNDPMFQQREVNQQELIAWTLKTHPLVNAPGTKFDYSNFGYCLLGRVIERVTEQPYAQFVQAHVMKPAGITDMRIADAKGAAPNEVHYYVQGAGDPYNMPIARMDSHGGWLSTATDMARFLAALFSPRDHQGGEPILSAASLDQMTAGTVANPGYACGLLVNGARNNWHAGSLPGTTSLMVHTKSGMSWAAVLNTRSTNGKSELELDEMLWKIARTVPEWRA